MNNEPNRVQALTRIGIVAFVVILLSGFYLIWQRANTVAVNVKVAPSTAKVTINGKKSSGGIKRLKAGEYSFVAKQDGFKDATQKITVADEPMTVTLLLEPANEATENWLTTGPGLGFQQEREELGAERASIEGEEFTRKNPITAKLPVPFNQKRFEMTYEILEDNSVVVQIYAADPEARAYAIQEIKDWGFDPAELKLQFLEFKNPITGEGR